MNAKVRLVLANRTGGSQSQGNDPEPVYTQVTYLIQK